MTDEEAITAGELALGLLDGEERAAALRLMIADPAFAREVERWRARFAALHDEWPEVDPGPRIDARIGGVTEPKGGVSGTWRWIAAATSAAAAVLLAMLVAHPSPAPVKPASPVRSAPTLLAVIKPSGGAAFGALVDLDRRVVRFSGAVSAPADRQAELWAIGSDGVPHAAGLLTPRGSDVPLRRDVAIGAGTTLAISIEPVGGSPKPVPTGPVVATGTLTAV